jgi:predicted nucleic acid-binding protein
VRIAFDSNILVYLAGLEKTAKDAAKIASARTLHINLAQLADCIVPLQAIGELYTVLSRSGMDRIAARECATDLQLSFESVAANEDTFGAAIDLATDHSLQFWDALILNVAADAGCSLLLSEDMQDGFAWRGVTVVNPFAKKLHKRLARVLE